MGKKMFDWGFTQFMPLTDIPKAGYLTSQGSLFVSVDISVKKATPSESGSDPAAASLGGNFGRLLVTGDHSDIKLEVSARYFCHGWFCWEALVRCFWACKQ